MNLSNWFIVCIVILTGSGIEEARANCNATTLQGEIRTAYVCVHGDLDDVGELPSEAEWIEFEVSRINYLPPGAFSRFHNLRRLTFYNCDLRQISNDAFSGLDKLEWLVLSNTKINLARAAMFRHLTNLRKLDLDGAGLLYIEPEVFHSFRRLESLNLRDNELDCLPIDALAALTRLKTLQIDKNPWLCDCRNSIGHFLKSRHINGGQYNTTSSSTRRYDCMTNMLEYQKLPEAEASFEEIDRQYSGRYEWRETDATSITILERLPDDIGWIQIFDVQIETIPHYAFIGFGNTLRSIEFQRCGIRDIAREAFAGLHRLERLTLVGNRLTTVKHEWFRDLASLTDLVLRNNGIQSIEMNSLAHLRSLKSIDIRGNRLTCLPDNFLRGPRRLEKINFAGNPLGCGCKADLENYLIHNGIGYNTSARCDQQVVSTVEQDDHRITWNSTVRGKFRWCWAYGIHRPGWSTTRRPTITTTTTIAPKVERTTTRRPGGCSPIPSTAWTGSRSCACTSATLDDLELLSENVEIIVYSSSFVSTIHNNAFRKFGRYLKRLEFHGCSIETVERGAFYGLYVLETLVIRGNYLTFVSAEWFVDTPQLRVLDLRKNGITSIAKGAFDNLRNIVHIDISQNRINCIGTDLFANLRNLQKLELVENPWTCLCIRVLVQFMCQKNIDCDCNMNSLIESSVGSWDCRNTNGSSPIDPNRPTHPIHPRPTFPTNGPNGPDPTHPLPPRPPYVSTTSPTRPTQPSVHPPVYPPTTYPPRPAGTCYQSNENSYHCANGDISILLNIPSYVTKIEIIDCYIPHLGDNAFARFENLTELVLINCTLSDIHPHAFAYLYRLEKLILRGNEFTIVKNGWFHSTRNLIWLDMSDNRLEDFETGCLEELKYLEYLNFEGNAFECVYTSWFEGLPSLRTVEFGRNSRIKWRCWKSLQYYLETRVIRYTNYTCPQNGREVLKNVLKCDNPQNAQVVSRGTGFTSLEFTMIMNLLIVVVASLCV